MFLNGIYYQTYGDPSALPVLLIHGSTMTGEQDFVIESDLAQRLARDHFVVVPDCPGHGQSLNKRDWGEPGHLGAPLYYSFSSMAAILAELMAALHASPCHVIGHSNGGNIALYMAVEQPQHTRTAVLLAANAYIDDQLRQRVPVKMNPDYVAERSPDWMREMMDLHDTHHGAGYWRALLEATITETITNPDWTPDHLKPVQTPCLCVQGENDSVNVPGHHAQILAAWLPHAQLWTPANTGHSVHHERPDEFEQHVRTFFAS